ncbi:uncharacterized protein V6R79_021325 [Siganus canaliculatus]
MSTSDAGYLELRVVGGETATPLYGTTLVTRTTTKRQLQDEPVSESFKLLRHHGDETPRGHQSHPSAFRHEALILEAHRPRQEEAVCRGDSEAQTQKPIGPRFTSSISFRLSRDLSLDCPELSNRKNSDSCLHSSTGLSELQSTENSSCLVNGHTPAPGTFVKEANNSLLPVKIPVKKKEEVRTAIHNELETSRDLSCTQLGSGFCTTLCILPSDSQLRTGNRTPELEKDIKDCLKLEKQADIVDLSNSNGAMLSSTMVTVLAPHWSGRLRRSKRFEGTGVSEAQDVTNTTTNHPGHKETMDMPLTDESLPQTRVQYLVRRNTIGSSSKSGPVSLGYESERKISQSASLDLNSERLSNRPRDGALSPLASTVAPFSTDRNEQRKNPQIGRQRGLSTISSKPTTSSLLLSLRKFNSVGKNLNIVSTFSDMNPASLSNSPSDQNGKLFTTHLSQNLFNNAPERPKPLVSPTSISCRTETGSVMSPSTSSHRERTAFEKRFFPTVTTNKNTNEAPLARRPTTNRTLSSLSCSNKSFLNRGPSESQLSCRGSDADANVFSQRYGCSTRQSRYDHSPLLKAHSLPGGTSVTSTSWRKQVTQEGPMLSDATDIINKPSMPLVPPCNGLASQNLTDNKRISSHIQSNRDCNNSLESVHNSNINLVVKKQEIQSLKQPDTESDRQANPQCALNLNIQESQKSHSLPDVLCSTKMSRTTEQTLSPSKNITQLDGKHSSLTSHASESQIVLHPKSSNAPTERSAKYSNSHCAAKAKIIPASPCKGNQMLTRPSLATLSTLNVKPPVGKTATGLLLNPSVKTSSAIQTNSVPSQVSVCGSSHTDASSKTPTFTNTSNITPLGFERNYAPFPKTLHPKTVCSMIPTVGAVSKTNHSSVSTTSHSSPSPTVSNPLVTTFSSPSLLPPSVTPSFTSSPTAVTVSSFLTPPTTPVITSPNDSDTTSPKERRSFSSSQERDIKKASPTTEGKKVRRVTWDDSVDLKTTDPIKIEKSDLSQQQSSASPSRPSRSSKSPPIFSSLRSSSQPADSSLWSPNIENTSVQVVKAGKYRSLSSDSADVASREQERAKSTPSDNMLSNQGRWDLTTHRQERTPSVESGSVQYRSSAPLSLPPDFSGDYKVRYSSPPYSSLMSARSTQGETKLTQSRSLRFQQPSESNYSAHHSTRDDLVDAGSLPTSNPPPNISPTQPLSLPFQNKRKCAVSETSEHIGLDKNNNQYSQNGQIILLSNRVDVSSRSSQDQETLRSPTALVTETLVYSIVPKVRTAAAASKNNTHGPLQHTQNKLASVETKLSQQSPTAPRYSTPRPLQLNRDTQISSETKLSQQSVDCKKAASIPNGLLDQGSSRSSSSETQPPNESNKRILQSVLSKSSDQSPKKNRFGLKKSGTPNSSLSRSDSDRANKTNNKMDLVLNKLRQTFSTRRSDDDMLFPWKWKRSSQTPSVSGSSDISSTSDISTDNSKTPQKKTQEEEQVMKDNEKETEVKKRWTSNRYTLTSPSDSASAMVEEQFCIPDASAPESGRDVCSEHLFESKTQPHLTSHSPTQQFDYYRDNSVDYHPVNQFLSCRDSSPGRSTNPSSQIGKSHSITPTPSPRSPFSPFPSLSPLSPFPSPDVTDDSVFYSPKLQRRRQSPSPFEPVEGISLGSSRRSRVSTATGPASASPGHVMESPYADLKYGIEPGRSFSVSSVLSSRPSGPGRISTGTRFMSVGDLSKSALTCGSIGKDLDYWPVAADWTTDYSCHSSKDRQMSSFFNDPDKMKTRSLPRSLTRRLANWSSGVPVSLPCVTKSKPGHQWNTDMSFPWDIEGPPTPPPTPPLSPVPRRVSKPPSLSSPTFPISQGPQHQVDSQSSRSRLPSREYICNLTTFQESSDSSSDTTTDDEYYLETGEDEEKETEL